MSGWTIVTGGAGFIGSHLVERLVGRGESVRVVERPGAATDHLPAGVDVVRADIRDPSALAPALTGSRWVYHLAANPNLWARDRREFDAVNHRGTVNVLDAALAAGAERVLHVSTESILTRARGKGAITEDVDVAERDAVGPYCLSKLRAEQAARRLAEGGAPVLIANPTMPVGPGDRGLSPPSRLLLDFCRGKLPALMDCTLNLVDVRDVADGLVAVMDRGRFGHRYLLGGTNVTLVELLAIISRLTETPLPRWRVPYPVGLAVAAASELWADWVSGRPPKATLTGVRLTRRTMHFDPARTQAELGLSVRDLETSLADAVAWFRGEGWLASAVSP
jgi:dihydroflavonol-4-reductase